MTPWASLATVLCLESCREHGVPVSLGRFMRNGLGLAVVALAGGIGALWLTR